MNCKRSWSVLIQLTIIYLYSLKLSLKKRSPDNMTHGKLRGSNRKHLDQEASQPSEQQPTEAIQGDQKIASLKQLQQVNWSVGTSWHFGTFRMKTNVIQRSCETVNTDLLSAVLLLLAHLMQTSVRMPCMSCPQSVGISWYFNAFRMKTNVIQKSCETVNTNLLSGVLLFLTDLMQTFSIQ